MRKILGILALAGLVSFGAAAGAGQASAQGLDVRVGVGGNAPHVRVVQDRSDRYDRYDRNDRPRHVDRRWHNERRWRGRPPMRTVCRTVMQQRVRGNGVVVRRPVEVCRRVVAGRY
jgi:hypothetical protein